MCDADNSGCGSVMADGMTVIRLLLKSILHPSMGSGKLPRLIRVEGSSDQTNNLG